MSIFSSKTVSKSRLVSDLRRAGIRPGDVVLVHSSLKKLGWVEEGITTIIEGFQEVLGQEGTLVMPTFTFSLIDWGQPPYNPRGTESRVGLLTEKFRRQDEVTRSLHPTHSFAAWGEKAEEFMGGDPDHQPLGIGSPLDRMREAGAKILLIGVKQNRNSTVHLAEYLAEMPYLDVSFSKSSDYDLAWSVESESSLPRYHYIRQMPGSSEGFLALEKPLRERRVIEDIRIGHAESQLMEAQHLCEVVVEMLREDPFLLLRGANPSEITLRRRRFLKDFLGRQCE